MRKIITSLLLLIVLSGFSQKKYIFGKFAISNTYTYDTTFSYCKVINDTLHLTKSVKVIEIDGTYFNITRSINIEKAGLSTIEMSPSLLPIGRWYNSPNERGLILDTMRIVNQDLFKKHPEWFQLRTDSINTKIRDTVYSTYDKQIKVKTGRDYTY